MLLIPIIIYDLLTVTNRLAGPIFRLRREMNRLAQGNSLEPLAFREGDYWQEVAGSFNQIRDELLALREVQMSNSPEAAKCSDEPLMAVGGPSRP